MRVLKVSTRRFEDMPWAKLYFRKQDQNLGPVTVPMPKVYQTHAPIPIESRNDPNLASDKITAQIIEDTLERDLDKSIIGQKYDIRHFHYSQNKRHVHIETYGNSNSLVDVLAEGVPNNFFSTKPIGYTEWLRLFFDWTKPVEIDDRIVQAMLIQDRAHKIMRLIGDYYLLDSEQEIIWAEDDLRIACPDSEEYIDFLVGNRKEMPPDIEELWCIRADKKRALSNRVGELRSAFEDHIWDLPHEVGALMQELIEIDSDVFALITELGGEFGPNFRDYSFDILLRGYDISQIQFLDGKDDTAHNNGSWDIETTCYRGSIRTPDENIPIDPRVWLIALSANKGIEEFESPLFEFPPDIEWPLTDVAIGYLDIGSDWVELESGERMLYIQQPDANLVVRTFSLFHQMFQLSRTGGHNTWSYDASRSMNPNRDPNAIAELPQELREKNLFVKLFTQDQKMCLLNNDNSPIKFRSQAWPIQFDGTIPRADTLYAARFHLALLTLDGTLESLSAAIDFFSGAGIEFEKSIPGYNQVELAVEDGEADANRARDAVEYGAGDTINQLKIINALVPIMEKVEDITGIQFDTLFHSTPRKVASLVWERKFSQEQGVIPNWVSSNHYDKFNLDRSKTRALSMAYERVSEEKLKCQRGLFRDVALFYTPFFTETSVSTIIKHPILNELYSTLNESDDKMERIFIQRILDNLAVYYLLDAKTSMETDSPADGALYYRYGTQGGYGNNANTLLSEFRKSMDDLVLPLENAEIINYTGDYLFVDNDPRLVEELEELGYIFVGAGDVVSMARGSVAYQLREDELSHLASVGFKMQTPKKRHTPDSMLKGFDPNFYDKWIHDLVITSIKEGSEGAEGYLHDQILNLDKLPTEEFFMTLNPGKDAPNYSIKSRSTRRFKILDFMGLEGGQSRTMIVSSMDGHSLEVNVVDACDPDSWTQVPHIPYYLEWAFEKNRNLMKLCKALGIKESVEDLLFDNYGIDV